MVTLMAREDRKYTAAELTEYAYNYPINLFLRTSKEAMGKQGILTADPADINGAVSYIVPRLVSKEHAGLLNNADVKLTDNVDGFFSDGTDKFVPSSRSRVYSVKMNSKTHRPQITFLLRHSMRDNYTDAQELISFLGFIEGARHYVKSGGGQDVQEFVSGRKKNKTSAQVDALRDGEGMTLSRSRLGLKTYYEGVEREMIAPVMQHAVDKIDVELKRHGIAPPKKVLYGNDFSVPLLIGTGVITDSEFDYIRAYAKKMKVDLLEERDIENLKSNEDKEILRQYSAIQYLSRYSGNNETMLNLKRAYEQAINSIRTKIVSPSSTALGSTVDIIDFSNLEDEIIENISNIDIKRIVRRMKDTKFSYFSLPYPLGENVYGLTHALSQKFGIEDFGFFGKVGVVPTPDSKVERGRVVMPKNTAPSYLQVTHQPPGEKKNPINTSITPFPNSLKPNDTVIISNADAHKVLVSVNGLTLQDYKDVQRWKKAIKFHGRGGRYSDLLLDMEAHWFNKACQELGIIPASIYYVSDKTLEKYDPYESDDNKDHTIVNSLGVEGTLASLVSPFTILKKWVGFPRRGTIYTSPKKKVS
jgi:hypothetical protein